MILSLINTKMYTDFNLKWANKETEEFNEVILKNNISINLKAVCITGAFNFELTLVIVHKYFL